jgi:cytochrome b561
MQWRNSNTRFGTMAVLMHWLVALTVLGLFTLGWWMTGLDYYDSWYKQAPWWHKSIGVLLFALVLLRLGWRWWSPPPQPLPTHEPWERVIAQGVHLLLYLLLLLIPLCGYLISTADNRAIEVFGWFSIPATITSITDQADVAGQIHLILASSLIGLALLHALAALKHHFIDRDATLKRIFGR